jgi:uncharacterized protein with PIN domain
LPSTQLSAFLLVSQCFGDLPFGACVSFAKPQQGNIRLTWVHSDFTNPGVRLLIPQSTPKDLLLN